VDRLARIQVLHRSRGPEYAAYRAALEKEARESADHAAALGKWMLAADGATNALRWLTALPAAVRTNLPVPLVVADAQVAAKDWTGLLATTSRQDWSEANFFRSALESLALRSTDQAGAARAAWQRALRLAATRPEQLMRLSKISADWGWSVERLEVLQELVSRFPKQTWAVDELIASFYGSGNSRALGDLLGKLHAAHPDDARLKNNLAAIWLLRKSNLAEAHKLAREAFETAPDNPFFASTFAYSLLVQGKPSEAVHAFDKVNPDHYAKIPAIAAYYGVVHAQAGLRDVARAPLQLAAKARLLPEEQELVRLAAARL
jgi:Flp pilus assembly protein TadD